MKHIWDELKEYKKLGVAIGGFTCFLFSFFMINQLTNTYDGFWKQSYYIAGDHETSNGRWLWPYTDRIRYGIHVDPISSMISIAFFVLGFIFVLLALDVKNSMFTCLLGGMVLFSSPIFSSIMAYRFNSGVYSMAFMFAAFAAYACSKFVGDISAVTISSLFIALSMGLYQSYAGSFCLVGLLVVICLAIRDDVQIKEILVKMGRFLGSFIIGGVLYYVLLLIHLKVRGNVLEDYNGVDSVSFGYIIMSLPKSAKKTYNMLGQYLGTDIMTVNTLDKFHFRTVFNVVLITAFLLFVFLKLVKSKDNKLSRIIVVILCVLLTPLGINVASILAPDAGTMPQMFFAFALFSSLLFMLIIDRFLSDFEKKTRYCTAFLTILVVGAIYGQSAQVLIDHSAMHDGYLATTTLAQGVLDDLRREGALGPEKSYFFIGSPAYNETFCRTECFNRANEYAKVGAFWLEQSNMYAAYKAIFSKLLGYNLNVLNDPYESKAYDEYFKTLPCYPNKGYITNWDTVVIKISEP